MRKLFLGLGAAGAAGNLSLVVWEAVSMASTQGAAAVAAFQKGFLTSCALLGPMLGAHLVRKWPGPALGRNAFGALCFAVILCAMAFNAKQSLDAMMRTTDQTIAERSKAKDATVTARAELKRLQALPALSVPPTTAEAVAAAAAAAKTATGFRVAECGENNEKRRTRCREREADEKVALDTVARLAGFKAATDDANKITARKETLEAQLRDASSVTDADPGAAVWTNLLGIDPELGRTWQGIAGVVLIELMIAFLLLGAEMLRDEGTAKDDIATPAELAADQVSAYVERPQPRLASDAMPTASIIDFAARELERAKGGRLEFGEFYVAYRNAATGARPLSPTEAVEPTQRLCAECGIAIESVGASKYLLGVRLKKSARQVARLGPMVRLPARVTDVVA